ncbi:MAG: hypothetical protein COV72_06225 [Candidatus Omnitrophica bacterium CG11_big_fil_rev_8_21_14_0_20_42_13]|uniref:Transcription factor zinc-finger domain-containing protein n=1 Tax=Candidatus Ghiorseimicrobium undicola TaxID=1974746 RepID=A0A2H0LWS0_9BACT|nr:MAG: hypothetical protein COV72_06225 [Candidatus Omnitrophica bacterium CG11_big_fil_rev_8_21_14_0_20_42_13]
MDCPVCKKKMSQENLGGVLIDICKDGCKGIWLDWMEIRKLDEKNEGFGKALKEALNYLRTNDDNRGVINCPKCNKPMHMHKYQSSNQANIDECYSCGGFFLDSGELKMIRDGHMSEAEEKEYTEKLISNMPEYGQAENDLEKEKNRAQAIRKYGSYITSYYIKGKFFK